MHSRVDNFTDAIMLMKAAYPVYPVDDNSMMLMNVTPVDVLLWSIANNPSWHLVDSSPVKTLTLAMENPQPESLETVWCYPLYWHGYLVILKPALTFFNVADLRLLNLYWQMFLIATALILIYKKLGLREMYAFLLVIAVINPVTTAMNFQNTDIFCIMLLATIFILWKNEFLLRGKNYLYFFLIIGIVTTYFDFLTYPIVSLGIPLCVCVMINRKFFCDAELKGVLTKLFSYSFAWGFGYGGMWAGKWSVAYILAGYKDVFKAAINQILYRSSLSEGEITFITLDIFKRNFDAMFSGPLTIILGLLIILFLCLLIIKRQKISVTKSIAVTFLFIAVLPLLWYLVVKNHSYVHPFLAYRDLSITIFGLTCFFIEALKEVDR